MKQTMTMVQVDADDLFKFINFADQQCLYEGGMWTIRQYLFTKATEAIGKEKKND